MTEEKLYQLLKNKDYGQIKSQLSQLNEVDAAELLDPLEPKTTLLIFRMLPKDLAAEVFAHFSRDQQAALLGSFTDQELKEIVDDLYFDDVIDMIEEVPANVVNKILDYTSPEKRGLVNQFLNYPEDSAGSLMTIEYVELKGDMTVGDALAHIKSVGMDSETIYTCYVTGQNRFLKGIVSLRKLVVSDRDLLVEDIMDKDIIMVNTHDDQEDVAGVFSKYGFIAIPVVDNENRLTGIITIDDIMDVIEQEATEDFQILAGISPSEEEYMTSSVLKLTRNRFPWLMILMLSATLSQRIMSSYEEAIMAVTALSFYIPMLMDTGGNAGNQSSTLVIRGLATGDIKLSDAPKIIWKEFGVAIISGLLLASINFFKVIYIDGMTPQIAGIVSITLIATVLMANISGGLLPLLAEKLKLDPAVMAGPLITTVVDAISLVVYFSIAKAVLSHVVF